MIVAAGHHREGAQVPRNPQSPWKARCRSRVEFPIVSDGKVIGGIGASGGSGQQDGMVAQAGANALAGLSCFP